jgi:mannitol operon repressor
LAAGNFTGEYDQVSAIRVLADLQHGDHSSGRRVLNMARSRKHVRLDTEIKLGDLQGFADEFQRESDRAAAILAAALLDERLRRLLHAFMIDDETNVNLLLETEQPVGTFGARIRLAYCLGLVDDRVFKMLLLIKSVRNAFAHQLHGLSFESPGIVEDCTALRLLLNFPAGFPETPRFSFISATFSAQQTLWSYTTSMEVGEKRRKVPQWKTLFQWKAAE